LLRFAFSILYRIKQPQYIDCSKNGNEEEIHDTENGVFKARRQIAVLDDLTEVRRKNELKKDQTKKERRFDTQKKDRTRTKESTVVVDAWQ
jgi:hypothetical protein